MKILFMGTPDFAVDTLQTLLSSSHQVIGVVTQPDKPKGRSGKMQFSPVKEVAVNAGIPIYQPQKVQDEAFLHTVRSLGADVIVVVAFGQILSKEILDTPQYGCLNVHASLLPKLRGAAPIQWSVIQGEKESGVTIMQMDEGLDTGDILLVKKCVLEPKETGGSLFEKLAKFGGPMILKVLEQLEQGTVQPVPQREEEHTYARMLSKANGQLDFHKPAAELERLIRGLNPWPSAYCFVKGKLLKVWEADVIDREEAADPGTVVAVGRDDFIVQTGEGCLRILSVQLEGKKRMECGAFLRGFSLAAGDCLTAEREACNE
ncbi:MAG: methionyl-tRNA formyltransferase [Clostridiaceae bacterium]|nr:methionyl-tRNA formyltransferase [Clostridiaceae bacterium]